MRNAIHREKCEIGQLPCVENLMFMGCLPKVSIFLVSSKPTCKVKRRRRVQKSSQIVKIILCGHVLGIMRSIMRFQTERGGLVNIYWGCWRGMSCCSNTFPSLRGNEQKMLKDRLDTFLSP